MAQALINIDHICRRNGLGKGREYGPARRQAKIKLIRPNNRADLDTFPACGTFFFIHVPGLFENAHLKIANISLDVCYLAHG